MGLKQAPLGLYIKGHTAQGDGLKYQMAHATQDRLVM